MFLSEKHEAQCPSQAAYMEATFKVLLSILRVMYGRPQFLPLHASVKDRMCRPWNLVVMKEVTTRFREQAHTQDVDGNLTIERDRAIAKGYAKDTEKYHEAVTRCLQFLLEANPKSASGRNGNRRLPLHLAIKNRTSPFDNVIEPLLNLAPRALFTRDMTTRFYPFAAAAMGVSSNLDVIYLLLLRDPTVL